MIFHNWQKARIKDIGRVITGRTPSTKVSSYFGNKYPFITPSDMREEKNIYEAERGLSAQGATLLMNNRIPLNSIAVSCIGWQMGKVAMISSVAFTNQQINTIIPTNQHVDPDFIYYSLCTRRKELQNLASVGTRTPILKKSGFENIEIYFPSLPTQRTIASILSAYDDLIENNTRRIAILEEMAQMIYEEWFVQYRFPGNEQLESEGIPEGWEMVRFFDIAEVMSGGTPKTTEPVYWNGSIPFYTPKDAPNSFFVTETDKSITEVGLKSCSSQLYPPNTIFITARGTVGRVALNAVDMAMNQSCYALKGREGMSQLFIFLHIMNSIRELKQTANGAVFETIIVDTFKWLQVAKPPLALIDRFTIMVTPIFEQMLNLTYKNANLRRTRDLLLPKLISGEIDVSSWTEGDVQEIAQELAASAFGTTNGYELRTNTIRKVAEAGPIEPIEKDALEWPSLWE